MSQDRDGGFTVIELLMSMAILTIIIGAISSALIVFLSNGSYTLARDDHSGGAAVLASYLDRDLASADSVALSASASCGTGDKDVVLRWNQWTASASSVTPVPGQAYSAAYDLVADGDGTHRLERTYCRGTTQLSRSVLLEDLVGGDISTAGSAACGPSSTPLVVTLAAYAEDSLSDYAYTGCLAGRLG